EDAVPRRARLIARDDPLLTEQTVDERGLADIRPADDGNTDAFRGGIRRSRRRLQLEPGESLRHQVLAALPVTRRDRERLPESERMKIGGDDVEIQPLRLVDGERRRLAGFADLPRDEIVLRRET